VISFKSKNVEEIHICSTWLGGGVQVVEVTEEYTSKTCTKCGRINQKLGGSKVFRCGCGMVLDRDFNGARNILLKYTRTII
jgi:putative transposase